MKIQKYITMTEEHNIDITEITLLSVDEAESISDKIRNVGAWWWLRSPGYGASRACTVGFGGYALNDGFRVDFGSGGVRPVLRIRDPESSNLTVGDKFTLAGYDWTVINKELALCDDIVGKTCFQRDYKADDANDYEKSDVKKWLENWAAKHGIEIKVEECEKG